MPKFIDEAHRERWMEGQRLAREAKAKRLKGEQPAAPPCTSVVQAKPAKKPATVVEAAVVRGGELLDHAIDRLRGELDVLIEAKTILERHEK